MPTHWFLLMQLKQINLHQHGHLYTAVEKEKLERDRKYHPFPHSQSHCLLQMHLSLCVEGNDQPSLLVLGLGLIT